MTLSSGLQAAAARARRFVRQPLAFVWIMLAGLALAAGVKLFAWPREAAELFLDATAVYGIVKAFACGTQSRRTHS